MANIFKNISGEYEIFKDERVLMPDYLPEVLPFREKEIEEIALALKPAGRGGRNQNLVLTGSPGTGKTACVRFVLAQLSEYSQRAVPVYVNCWENTTRHGILNKIATSLGEFVPRRGISTDEIIEKIVESLRKESRTPIVALDEVDRLFASQYEEEKVLYDLLRANEIFSVRFGVIAITNFEGFLAELDARVRSSLGARCIEFKKYTPTELKEILGQRAEKAFVKGTIDGEIIGLCAAYAAKNNSDARLAINCLWQAGKVAENENAKKVDVEHVKKGFSEVKSEDKKLAETEEKIMLIVEEKGEITSGELYKRMNENERTIRNYLSRLEKLGIIETELDEKRGKTRIIRKR